MWRIDKGISDAIGWCVIQSIYHPWAAFFTALIGFALYCWLVDYIGYVFIRSKYRSEPLERVENDKGEVVAEMLPNASERLYGSDREHLAFILSKHDVSTHDNNETIEPELINDLIEWKNQ